MPSNVTVFYNQPKEGEYFDMDYYINKHMPIANEQWTPLGLKSWQVLQFGPDAPFHVVAVLNWENEGQAEAALAHEASKIVIGDVVNFTNMKANLQPGSITGAWERK
ncbi:hypothetical protein ACSS6W_008644 [Trichoderma asperelloides]|uniref:EthD domain-containing protein n=2 Tax=Trichoderma asperellum TaxID=101201 RepID=A0A6V8R100_TRIAP|nr:hypothetical protein M441DRAFT_60319 [Trichoderma asperellum CBS 433.97]KAH8127700.1 hypothetical protein LI328DRAFT_130143 [Trichoderma asperelloides]PTB38012.1 hypothetical protein M441DRAFT_60319 [Trichoderma asperellum CBS 433.97]UKZ97113.1 hypothetical protein TrAFT101_011881 [Trichoderma asperellum]GFP58677.1 hypothetical protein TASIC1_0011004400 [Trichoderma asperellum]